MDAISALQNRVRAKQAEIEQARRRVALLETEFRVWEEALAIAQNPASETVDHGLPALPVPVVVSRLTVDAASLDKRRGPRGAWRVVMPIAARVLQDEFGYAELSRLGEESGASINRHTLRSQMANYVNSGFLERMSEGRFRFTDKGKAEFQSLSRITGSAGSGSERSGGNGAYPPDLLAGDSPPDAPNRINSTGTSKLPEGG